MRLKGFFGERSKVVYYVFQYPKVRLKARPPTAYNLCNRVSIPEGAIEGHLFDVKLAFL